MQGGQSVQDLGLALATGDEKVFQNAVKALLHEDKTAIEEVQRFAASVKSEETWNFNRKIQKILRQLEKHEFNLVLKKFVPGVDMTNKYGGTHPLDDPKETPDVRLYNSLTGWLSMQLLDWDEFKCNSASRLMICRVMARWIFWMSVLDRENNVEIFCTSLCDDASREEACDGLVAVLDKVKVPLSKSYDLLSRAWDSRPSKGLFASKKGLYDSSPSKGITTPKKDVGRKPEDEQATQAQSQQDSPPELETVLSTAPRNDLKGATSLVRAKGEVWVFVPKSDQPFRALLDTKAPFSSIERSLLREKYPKAQINKLPRNSPAGQTACSEEAVLQLSFCAALDGKLVWAEITQDLVITDRRGTGMLLGYDTIASQGIQIDTAEKVVVFTHNRGAKTVLEDPGQRETHGLCALTIDDA